MIQLERRPILPDQPTYAFLRPVDVLWRETKGGGLVVFRSVLLYFSVLMAAEPSYSASSGES